MPRRKSSSPPASSLPPPASEGWQGWDEYAPFYDWENARTLGRRDVAFWQRVTSAARGPVLELGCGTGRVSLPLARAGVDLVGIDRSAPMLARAGERARRGAPLARLKPRATRSRRSLQPRASSLPPSLAASTGELRRGSPTRLRREGGQPPASSPHFVRGDIRALPFRPRRFAMVLAPYGILQSLVRERDLAATLESVARVLEPGGLFGIDLVPDVPNWREYRNQVRMRGRAGGAHLTLVESVRQDPRRRLTTFDQVYVERRGRQVTRHRFALTFRTLSVRQMAGRLERAGFAVESVLGDYRGRPWDARADVWIILARRR